MDETLKRAYQNALASIAGQLDAIFTLQAQNAILTEKNAKLEAQVAELLKDTDGD